MKYFHTILAALFILGALCPHCWAQRQIEEGARHVAYHPKRNIFATSSWAQVKLWSLRGKPLATVAEHEDGEQNLLFRGVAFNPEGTILACATWGSVRLYNVENPEKPKVILFPQGDMKDAIVVAVAYSPDGAILAWRTLTDITLWHIKEQKIIGTKKAEQTESGIAFSHDGNALAWATPKEIVIWNVKEPKQAAVIKAEPIGAPAFSPKEDVLVWREKKRVALWNTKTLQAEHFDTEGGNSQGSGALAFSRDGKRLAIFGNCTPEVRGTAVAFEVLDFASGLTVARFSVNESHSIAFSLNGETVVIGGSSTFSQHYIGPPR